MNTAERILQLVERNGITAAQLLRETNLPSSSISTWRKGLAKPSSDAIVKIASYFGVSTDFLLTGREHKDAITLEGSPLTTPPELLEIVNAIRNNKGDFTQIEINEVADFINFIKLKRDSRKKEFEYNKNKGASKSNTPL